VSPQLEPTCRTVAIVDDDRLVRVTMGSLIMSIGYIVETFESGPAFLEQDTKRFACLITDLQMPDMTGLELQARLGECDSRLPIIFLTAFREDWARDKAHAAGARGFFQKPCDLDAFVGLIERIVGPPSGDPLAGDPLLP